MAVPDQQPTYTPSGKTTHELWGSDTLNSIDAPTFIGPDGKYYLDRNLGAGGPGAEDWTLAMPYLAKDNESAKYNLEHPKTDYFSYAPVLALAALTGGAASGALGGAAGAAEGAAAGAGGAELGAGFTPAFGSYTPIAGTLPGPAVGSSAELLGLGAGAGAAGGAAGAAAEGSGFPGDPSNVTATGGSANVPFADELINNFSGGFPDSSGFSGDTGNLTAQGGSAEVASPSASGGQLPAADPGTPGQPLDPSEEAKRRLAQIQKPAATTPAPAQTFSDKLIGNLTKNPLSLVSSGVNMLGQANSRKAGKDLEGQLKAAGAQTKGVADKLLNQGASPSTIYEIDKWLQQGTEQIAQRYASMGRDPTKDSAAAKEVADLKAKAVAMKDQATMSALQQGLSAASIAQGPQVQAALAGAQQDKELAASMSGMLQNMAMLEAMSNRRP